MFEMLQQLKPGARLLHTTRQAIPRRSGSVGKQPPRSRQAETGQLENSRARGGGPRLALGHRTTWAKHCFQDDRSRSHMQCPIHIDRVTSGDRLCYTGPAERGKGRANVIIPAEAGDKPCREMQDPLQSVQTGFGGATPD